MKLATFNIYWLGHETYGQRTPNDIERIARVLKRLDADLYAFQEICDFEVLETVLAQVNSATSRRLTVRHPKYDRLLSAKKGAGQNVAFAYDTRELSCERFASVKSNGWQPLAAHFRAIKSERDFTVVAVHLKSGQPTFTDLTSANKRTKECRKLVAWLEGSTPSSSGKLSAPFGDGAIVLGDFNALIESDQPIYEKVVSSLDPLRTDEMANWWWEAPQIEDPDWPYTSITERYVLDYVMVSPELINDITETPWAYPFDKDDEPGGPVEDLPKNFRIDEQISDHRPVVVSIDL